MAWASDSRKIGFGLTAFGMFFTFLGVLMFFDQALLAMGNLMFLIGITLTIGTSHVMSFFLARKKLRGTCTFFVGMALVMYGWPVVGIMIEGFGFMNLFWNFFPIAMSFLSRVPYVGEPAVAAITVVTNALAKIPGIGDKMQGLTQTLPGAGLGV